MGGREEGSRQPSGEGKANLSVRKCGTEQRTHILCQLSLETGSVRSCAGRRQARDSVGRNRQNDPRGSRVCWSFQHPSSFVPLLIHMHITPLNSLSPLLSARWWELLNIYEASRPLVLLWVLGTGANECVPAQGDPKPGKGTATQRLAAQFPGPEESGRMKGGEAVARRETNGPATQKKAQSSIFACWNALEWVGMCVRQGTGPLRFPSRK